MGTINHVFMLGNGFDINLDLATSYKEFYEYYLNVEQSKNNTIDLLRNNIKSESENWSDLELNLGRFTKLLETQQNLDDVIEDMVVHLSKYLEKIESNIDWNLRGQSR